MSQLTKNSHKMVLLCAMFSENFLEEMLPCYTDYDFTELSESQSFCKEESDC